MRPGESHEEWSAPHSAAAALGGYQAGEELEDREEPREGDGSEGASAAATDMRVLVASGGDGNGSEEGELDEELEALYEGMDEPWRELLGGEAALRWEESAASEISTPPASPMTDDASAVATPKEGPMRMAPAEAAVR